jgi:hypothetical protein
LKICKGTISSSNCIQGLLVAFIHFQTNMDSSNLWGLSDDDNFVSNDEEFLLWAAELNLSQFPPFEIDPGQSSMQLQDIGFQHYSTSPLSNLDRGESSGSISNDYPQLSADPSPATTTHTIPTTLLANNTLSEESSAGQACPANISRSSTRALSAVRSLGNGKKHKLEDLIHEFPADPKKGVATRKRKAFSLSRRAEVNYIRSVGACFQCKKRKASVSIYKQASKNAIYEDLLTTKCHFGLPCRCCLTRFGSLEIVREICTRQSIISTRFDNVGEYILYI